MSVKYVNIYIRSVGTFNQMLCVCVCERGKGDGVQGLIGHSFEYLKIDTKQNPEKKTRRALGLYVSLHLKYGIFHCFLRPFLNLTFEIRAEFIYIYNESMCTFWDHTI